MASQGDPSAAPGAPKAQDLGSRGPGTLQRPGSHRLQEPGLHGGKLSAWGAGIKHGGGSKRCQPLGTTGFGLFFVLPNRFFKVPFFDQPPHGDCKRMLLLGG